MHYVTPDYQVNPSTGEATVFYRFGGRAVARRTNSGLLYVLADHLSSSQAEVQPNQAEAGQRRNYPFGTDRPVSGASDIIDDERYTSQKRMEAGNGNPKRELYHYGARWYLPGVGVFTQPDSIVPEPKNPQALNRFSYCVNNPLKYIDPSGHYVVFADEDDGSWVYGGGGGDAGDGGNLTPTDYPTTTLPSASDVINTTVSAGESPGAGSGFFDDVWEWVEDGIEADRARASAQPVLSGPQLIAQSQEEWERSLSWDEAQSGKPDMWIINGASGVPVGGGGRNTQTIILDRYGRRYTCPGVTSPPVPGISISSGSFGGLRPEALESTILGQSVHVGGGKAVVGGGVTWSPSSGKAALDVGLYSPGPPTITWSDCLRW